MVEGPASMITAPVSEVGAMPDEGSAFDTALHKAYVARAGMETKEGDFYNANRFLDKATAAARGQKVLPEDPSSWPGPGGSIFELEAARVRLMKALIVGGRDLAPDAAARAQDYYDCWVEEVGELHGPNMRPARLGWGIVPKGQPEDAAACKAAFEAALAEVEGALPKPPPPPEPEPEPAPPPAPAPAAEPAPPPEPTARNYLIFFDWDKSDIRPDAAQILNAVLEAVRKLGSSSLTLVGHADRSGPNAYNQRLSERRGGSALDYLSNRGIPSGDVTTSGRGETDPRVPTPDGVREQENRRVEITIN
jgi:outer membrane protein OmpA-like peptidoglycan-associated protein